MSRGGSTYRLDVVHEGEAALRTPRLRKSARTGSARGSLSMGDTILVGGKTPTRMGSELLGDLLFVFREISVDHG